MVSMLFFPLNWKMTPIIQPCGVGQPQPSVREFLRGKIWKRGGGNHGFWQVFVRRDGSVQKSMAYHGIPLYTHSFLVWPHSVPFCIGKIRGSDPMGKGGVQPIFRFKPEKTSAWSDASFFSRSSAVVISMGNPWECPWQVFSGWPLLHGGAYACRSQLARPRGSRALSFEDMVLDVSFSDCLLSKEVS